MPAAGQLRHNTAGLRDFARREEVVLATKVFYPMHKGANARGLSRKSILTEIDASLRRLIERLIIAEGVANLAGVLTRMTRGWLIDGEFRLVDGGNPEARFFLGFTGAGRSFLVLHVRVTDVQRHMVVYEFDMTGGSREQGKLGTLRASGLGKATHFDLRNAAERIYLVLSTNPERYAAHSSPIL